MDFGKFIIKEIQNYKTKTSIKTFIKQKIIGVLDVSKSEICNIGVGGYGFVIPNFYSRKKKNTAIKFYFVPQTTDRSKIYFEVVTYNGIEYNIIIFNDTIMGEFIIGSIINEYLQIKNNYHSVIHKDIHICHPKFEAISLESLGYKEKKKLWTSLHYIIDYILATKNYISNPKLFFYIMFQVLFTLICLKKNIKFYHMDLHPGNVLIKHNSTKYKYFEYISEGKKIVIQNLGFIVKISDFGLSAISIDKFVFMSEPIVLPARVSINKTLNKIWPKYPHGTYKYLYPEYIELLEYFYKNKETTCIEIAAMIKYIKKYANIKSNNILFDMKSSWKLYKYPSELDIFNYLIKNNSKYIYNNIDKHKKLTIYE